MSSQVYGLLGLTQVNDRIKVVKSAPTTSTRGKLGDFLVVRSTGVLYFLSSVAGGTNTWIKYGVFPGDVEITGDLEVTGAVDIVGDTEITGDFDVIGNAEITGNLEVTGNISVTAGKSIALSSGAVTDFAGTGALTAGVLAIANTNIKATDIVLIQRVNANSSTAIGHLSYTIVADTSLTITSLKADATTETDDVSNIAYVIIKKA